jgi:hypothetical protein
MIYPDRCGKCKKFKGNAIKCPDDTHGRGILYANDYKCRNFEVCEV